MTIQLKKKKLLYIFKLKTYKKIYKIELNPIVYI